MISLMNSAYLYLKAAHLIAAFVWVAGMFYLPRLYVYHAQVGVGTPQAETFKVMESRLLTAIMNPAMIITVGLGLWIAFGAAGVDWGTAGWLHVKLFLVALMLVIHFFLAKWRRDFEAGRIPHSPRFFRLIDEVPTLLLIGVVILAVVKPF